MATNKTLAFSKEYLLTCVGFDPRFIDTKTSVSHEDILPLKYKSKLPKVEGNGKGILNYNGLSILYNKKRKVPFVAAYNIDGSKKENRAPRPKFKQDPRIPTNIQLDYPFYDLRTDITEFEIGHMASNNEMGRGRDGIVKAYQTFHFTNSVPQAENLNTGLWRSLESYIIKEAAKVKKNKRVIVFTGPILTAKDPGYVKKPTFQIPLLFYKVVVFMSLKGIYSTAFLMSHEKKMIEDKMFIKPVAARVRRGFFEDFPYREIFQVNISFLEKLSGLSFSWENVKKVVVPEQKRLIETIHKANSAAEAKIIMKAGKKTRAVRTTRNIPASAVLKKNFKLNIILP